MKGPQWTVDGKSLVASWGAYGLRVKRLQKGKYWWVVTGVFAGGKKQVKLKDGIARNSKEGRNEAEVCLCQVAAGYRSALVERRLEGVEWFKRSKEWKPQVGSVRV